MNKRIFVFLLYLAANTLLSGSLIGQNLVWDTTFSNNESGERLKDLVFTSNKDIIGVGWSSPNIGPEPSMLKFDSLGNFKWFKRLRFDSLENGNFNFIKEIPEEKDFYYVGGNSYELGVWNNDFIAKIDTSGDTLWSRFYNYPTFYGTTLNAIVLRDKSLITTGVIQTATFYDIISRRVDSLGNTIWETIYTMPGRQEGNDLTEMLDGSLVIAGSNDGDNLIMRIGFDGRLIDTLIITGPGNGSIDHQAVSCLQDNSVLITADSYNGNWYDGQKVILEENFNVVSNILVDESFIDDIIVNEDSTYYLEDYKQPDSMFLNNFDFQQNRLSTLLFPVNGSIRQINAAQPIGNSNMLLSGSNYQNNNSNYWIAKLANTKNPWIPDHCAYQPPRAGFEWEYNYPVLTLRDTSSGGLKYLDTVYTWQWSTSNGFSGTDDSLLVFFDTTFSKTITVDLVIGNWYGCTDTVTETLVFGPNGIRVEKPFEFKIYPNPVKEHLTIELSENPSESVLFELFDIRGILNHTSKFQNLTLHTSLSALPSGMYFYRISTGFQSKRGKVIKE